MYRVLRNPKQAIVPAGIGARNAFYPALSSPLTDGMWEECKVQQLGLGSSAWFLFILGGARKIMCNFGKYDWAEPLFRQRHVQRRYR